MSWCQLAIRSYPLRQSFLTSKFMLIKQLKVYDFLHSPIVCLIFI